MSKIYASRGERLLSLALERKSTNSWGKYKSEGKRKDYVGKDDSAQQLSVTEILHTYPVDSTLTSKEDSNNISDFDIFEESPIVTDDNYIDDISGLNLLNEVTNLFISDVGEVNDQFFLRRRSS